MNYQEYAAPPSLAEWVHCLWTAERDLRPLNGAIDLLPDSYVEIVFNFGAACRIEHAQEVQPLPVCYAVNLFDAPLRLRADGVLRSVGVRVLAWGVQPLLGFKLPAATTIHALDAAWLRLHACMAHAVRHGDDAGAVRLLQHHLVAQARRTPLDPGRAPDVARLLLHSHEPMTIGQVADACAVSQRQLERGFKTATGVSPKTFARKLRFQQVRDHLSREPDSDMAALAQQYGYADQAHLSREFKVFSHRTPSQFVARLRDATSALRYGVAPLPELQ